MKWIGLTGGLGSGKSTVAAFLRSKGWPVIDADQIAHQVLARGTPGLTKVLEEFGADLLLPSGELNRRELGMRVFGQPDRLLALEKIVHPLVQDEVQRQKQAFQQAGFQKAFYDVPLLFEKNIEGFDAVVVVTSDADVIRSRLKRRNAWADAEIETRIGAQIPLGEKEKRADHVIRNDEGLKELEESVDRLLERL
ncbi:MAG TPA: dephospho-CoA kinase [Pseudobdellovibrionaceae bacterium]|nr:dephospho-CoA kinase [Pseudobdellovibrionaceae bacterium]